MTAPRSRTGAPAGPRYLAAFAVLCLVVHEAHELAHTAAGRLVCGGWGPRDFNTWQLPAGCASLLPAAAGPALSYALMLAGAVTLGAARAPRAGAAWATGWGLALALAPNPFARLLTAAVGGGDEGVLVRAGFGLSRGPGAAAVAFGLVLALTAPALAAAGRAVGRARPGWFTLLLFTPMVVTGVGLFAGMNRLLAAGVLARPVLGAPALVHLVTLASAAALALTGRWLAACPPVRAGCDRAPLAPHSSEHPCDSRPGRAQVTRHRRRQRA